MKKAIAALAFLCAVGALAATVKLTWNASSGATSYNVYRATSHGSEVAPAIASGVVGTSYNDTRGAGTWFYTVTAVNTNGESAMSNEAQGSVVWDNVQCLGNNGANVTTCPGTATGGVGNTITTYRTYVNIPQGYAIQVAGSGRSVTCGALTMSFADDANNQYVHGVAHSYGGGWLDTAYVVASRGPVTYIDATRSSACALRWQTFVASASYVGTAALDSTGFVDDTVLASQQYGVPNGSLLANQVGTPLNIQGTSDFQLQCVITGPGTSSVTSPYDAAAYYFDHEACAVALNANSSTPTPQWTEVSGDDQATAVAVALSATQASSPNYWTLTGAFSNQYLPAGGSGVYTARVDPCVQATDINPATGHTCGTDGLTLNYQNRITDTDPFTAKYGSGYCGAHLCAPVNSWALDTDFNSLLVVASDDQTNPGKVNDFTISEMNDNSDVFNSDSSMFLFVASSGAGPFFRYLNYNNCVNHTGQCITNSQIATTTNPATCTANCTQIDTAATVVWAHDPARPNVAYEQKDLTVNILTICRTGYADAVCGSTAADTFTRTPYVNFADPTNGVFRSDFQVTWEGVFSVANDGSVVQAYGGEGSYQTALTNSTDTFALPVNNVAGYNITALSYTGTGPWTATATVSQTVSGNLQAGTLIPVRAVKPAASAYNGVWAVTSTGTHSISFQITGSTTPSCTTCTGNIGYASPAFQVTTVGTKGGSEPDWQDKCPAVGATCQDGTVVWTNIGNLNGQGPGFYVAVYHPATAAKARGYSLLNTRTGKIFRGAGEYSPPNAPGTPDPSGPAMTTDGLMCQQFGYGLPANGICPTPIPYGAFYTLHDTGSPQDSTYVPMSATGGGALPGKQDYAPADTPDCLPTNADYQFEGYTAGHTYAKNDAVWDPANPRNMYVCQVTSCTNTPLSNTTSWAGPGTSNGPIECYKRVWNVATNVINECMSRPSSTTGPDGCSGHEVHGYNTEWGGTYMSPHLWAMQTLNGVANPGGNLLPKPGGIPGDQHGTGRNENPTDTNPVVSSNTDVPAWTYANAALQFGGTGAGYGEFTAVAPDYSQKIYRFAHSYNSGVSPTFACQNNIAAISQDGRVAIIPSDFMGTRGSNTTAGQNGNGLRAMYAPAANHTFYLYDLIYPVGNNAPDNIYKATAVTGPTGSNIPNWSSVAPNPGDTVVDGGVTWTNQGPSTGRCDVMLVFLLTAH